MAESAQKRPDAPPAIAGSESTSITYSLRFTGWPTLNQIVAVAVATAVYTVFSCLSTYLTIPGTPIVSILFVAIGFGLPFALWFGGWAFVIAYIGNAVGAGLIASSPLPLPLALLFGTVDLIQLGLPMILYRLLAPRFGVSPIGKDVFTVRGFIFFLACAVLPNNIIGGLYGNFLLVNAGFNPPNTFFIGWFIWSLSNIVVILIIGSVLLKWLGPVAERYGLTIRNLFR
jgi:hypothetical protein